MFFPQGTNLSFLCVACLRQVIEKTFSFMRRSACRLICFSLCVPAFSGTHLRPCLSVSAPPCGECDVFKQRFSAGLCRLLDTAGFENYLGQKDFEKKI